MTTTKMRGATYLGAGGLEMIAIRSDLPQPVPGADDVLVAVAYAGLNRADVLERKGQYPVAPAAIVIPGIEYAGVVVAAGSHVTTRKAGDRVCGLVTAGAQAAYLVTQAGTTSLLPDDVSLREGAAIPEAFITAHDALFTRGRFALGERALVHAVGSSVGLAATALVERAGGVAFGTSRTPAKLERATAHGLDAGFLLDDTWVAKVRETSGGRGIDVILDFVAGGMFDANLAVLASRGRIVQIGGMGGTNVAFNVGALMGKRGEIHGTMLRMRPLEEKITLAKHFESALLPLFTSHDLRAEIDCVFTLDDLAKAHAYMENDTNFGKILIEVGGDDVSWIPSS